MAKVRLTAEWDVPDSIALIWKAHVQNCWLNEAKLLTARRMIHSIGDCPTGQLPTLDMSITKIGVERNEDPFVEGPYVGMTIGKVAV